MTVTNPPSNTNPTMNLEILVPGRTDPWAFETVAVTRDTTVVDVIKQLSGKKEGKYILTSCGLYARGSDLDSSKTVAENIKFVGGTTVQLRLAPKFSNAVLKRGEELLEQIREIINTRSGRTWAGLMRSLRIMDSHVDDRQLSVEELKEGLQKFGMNMSSDDAAAVMRAIDYDSTGTISIGEFVRAIRGKLNAPRLEVVKRAFEKFDRDGSGEITLKDLELAGYTYTQDKHMREFFNQFQEDQENGEMDDKITTDEFEEYYARVSANIDNDLHFVELVEKAWKLPRTV
eukprot:CAMPEP_0117445944 /NCGR_PEP_ID=MMETSP0759-20121206/6069_1 /TAXON_ID=63605 /ORGANISM="Percolomonas cosmopolitus, Strain WS" /LENGTH=287 /DNA_ID=CAMNT_0005238161 /DNA_START=29 /DNA_END=892 /DNA_ORIENTATION=-